MTDRSSDLPLPELSSDATPFLKFFLIGFLYFLAVRFSLQFVVKPDHISAFWVPNGILAAALLMEKPQNLKYVIATIFVANVSGNLLSENSLTVSLGFGVANVVEGSLIALVLRRIGLCAGIDGARDLLLVLLACLLGTACGALIGALNISAHFGWPLFSGVAQVWFVSDFLGNFLMLSLLMIWLQPDPPPLFVTRNRIEGTLAAVSVVMSTVFVFLQDFEGKTLPYDYILFPFLIWACMRMSKREVSLILVAVAFIAAGLTISGRGPFIAHGHLVTDYMIWLQMYLAALISTFLLLSVVFTQQRSRTAELAAKSAELAVSNEKLADANREQAEFTYAISHDLKSPANTISMLLRTLREMAGGDLDADSIEVLDDLQATTARMRQLVDDVLAYAGSVGDGMSVQPVDLQGIVQDIQKDLSEDISQAGARLRFENLPTVTGNAMQLRLLMQNLISNAIKFRDPARRPRVELAEVATSDPGFLAIQVRDNGIGIDTEFFDQIFRLFSRLHTHSAYPGSGIGLTVCRRIVSNHGGRVLVSSQKEKGSTFTVLLPRA